MANAAADTGPPDRTLTRKTLYNRFVRRAAKGVWERVFLALAELAAHLPASCSIVRS
jgi:hypothetical protein